MSEYRALALSALRSLRVRSPTSYSWCGAVSTPLTVEVEHAMSPDVAREFLIYKLQQELYSNFYCRGIPTAAGLQHSLTGTLGSPAFVEKLSTANQTQSTLQPGWRIKDGEAGQIVVERAGLALWVTPAQVISDSRPERVSLRLPGELRKASPGFYMALGERAITEEEGRGLVRIYWHLTSAAAPSLLDLLTRSLNDACVPFQLKVVNDPERYSRCDAGVLYVPKPFFEEIVPALIAAYRLLASGLRTATPALTKRLAPGLGLAEDPGDGQSFGMHRTLLLARAAVRAYELDCLEEQGRAELLEKTFAEQGLDLDKPYLCHGSSDSYAIHLA